MIVPDLNMVECKNCGATYWFAAPHATVIDGGPCCFGHKVIDVERFGTELEAQKVYPQWVAYQERAFEKAARLAA